MSASPTREPGQATTGPPAPSPAIKGVSCLPGAVNRGTPSAAPSVRHPALSDSAAKAKAPQRNSSHVTSRVRSTYHERNAPPEQADASCGYLWSRATVQLDAPVGV